VDIQMPFYLPACNNALQVAILLKPPLLPPPLQSHPIAEAELSDAQTGGPRATKHLQQQVGQLHTGSRRNSCHV